MKQWLVPVLLGWGLLVGPWAVLPDRGLAVAPAVEDPPQAAASCAVAEVSAPTVSPAAFRFLRTIQVTPDPLIARGGFVRVWQAPATGNLLVTFGGWPTAAGSALTGCTHTGNFYKEYTPELTPTGRSGATLCDQHGDLGALMVGNTFHTANMAFDQTTGREGWLIVKYDVMAAAGGGPQFTETGRRHYWLDYQANIYPQERSGDPMIAAVNGLIDVSSWYLPTSEMSHLLGHGTHHNLFTPDLGFAYKKILAYPQSPRHMEGTSLIFLDGFYYLITSDSFFGDVIVLKYDAAWNFIASKLLRPHGHWSTGLVFQGDHFYLVYLDTSLKTYPVEPYFPIYLNVHLAAFDRDWNLLEDVAVTDFSPANRHLAGRPGLLLRGNLLYVSYDVATITEADEELQDWQAHVSVYELPRQRYLPLVLR